MTAHTVLIVPGLREHVAGHWQTLLAQRLPRVRVVEPMGRTHLDCPARVRAIDEQVRAIEGPVIIVAHSAGCIMVAHWAQLLRQVRGALLVTPPDFDRPMPAGYPTIEELRAGAWLPVPRSPLPFPSIVAASRDCPLASYERVTAFAAGWCSRLVDIGFVGHLNPASGFGEWPRAQSLIDELATGVVAHRS